MILLIFDINSGDLEVAVATRCREGGRPAPVLTLRRRRWFVDIVEEKSTVA